MRIEITREGLLVYLANHYTTRGALASIEDSANLLSFLLRCSTRPHEWGAQ